MMMHIQSKIPLQIIRDLKCRHCGKFLSCGPIHVTPDGGNLCGRCQNVSKPNFRNYAYETSAALYLFPCQNWFKHCSRTLHWNESVEHERNCVHNSKCKLACAKPSVLFKKERKIPESGDIQYEHIPDNVQDMLKCYNCANYLNCDPVYLTSGGESICHRCVTSTGLPPSTIRNFTYERIAATLFFACCHRNRGCPVKFRFGRDMWTHENECSYAPPIINKKPTASSNNTAANINGKKMKKERGVIETHSGHYWGTITPHSAAFAPPTKNQDGKILTNELEQHLRMKYAEDDVSPGLSRQSSATKLSRPPTRESMYSKDEELSESGNLPRARLQPSEDLTRRSSEMIVPSPAPIGYQKVVQHHNSYYDDNNLSIMYNNSPQKSPNLGHVPSFNHQQSSAIPNNAQEVKRSASLRVGNADIINELKYRQSKKSKIEEEDHIPNGS